MYTRLNLDRLSSSPVESVFSKKDGTARGGGVGESVGARGLGTLLGPSAAADVACDTPRLRDSFSESLSSLSESESLSEDELEDDEEDDEDEELDEDELDEFDEASP